MPSPDTAPADLLTALAGALASLGVPWYVFGAQAALIWGRPRLTADVDVTVRIEPGGLEPLIEALEAAGFRLRPEADANFVRQTRVLPFVCLRNGLPLDVVLGGPGLEDVFLSRARPVQIGQVVIPVMSPEDLIVAKILAGRPKDLEDVRGVLRERVESLDLETIRSTLALLEDALGRSDLRPAFEGEMARTRP
jgi:hypothetical protein